MPEAPERTPLPVIAPRRILRALRGAFATPEAISIVAFLAVDLVVVREQIAPEELAPVCGYALLSAAILGAAGALCLALVSFFAARTAAFRGWRARVVELVAAIAAGVPGALLAGMITAGQSISASRWRLPVFAAVVTGAASGLVLLVKLLQRAPAWPARRRALAGLAPVALGCAAVALTAFHSTTYLGIHLVFLFVAGLLLQAGLSLQPFLARPAALPGARGAAVRTAAVLLVFAVAFALSRQGAEIRPRIGLVVFSDTLVAQKLTPLLFWASPITPDRGAARGKDALAGTRLDRFNLPPAEPLPSGRYRGRNVVWVSADAFRADALGPGAGRPSATPSLDALAGQSVVFSDAIVDFSHTSRSVLSVLSGRWDVNFPSERVVSRHPGDIADRSRLPRVLRKGGYHTVADMMGGRWGEVFFEKKYVTEFDEHVQPGPTCKEQVDWLRKFVAGDSRKEPFFVWMHIFDTHTPLQHPEVAESLKGRPKDDYAAAIRHVDGCVGAVIAALRDAGLWDRTLFAFFADHGEALGEHRRTLKHSTCYLHDVHVPLMFRLPGARARRDVGYRFQLSDLLPTTANLLGLDTKGEIIEGDDLSGFLGERPPPRDRGLAFSKGHPEQYSCAGVLSGPYHLIYTHSGRFYELYDVDRDPGETDNLVAKEGAVVERLRPMLDAYWAKFKIRHRSRAIRRPIPADMD